MLQNIPPIRGIHNANSSVRVCKSPFNNKLGVDYLKLHMMEKERVRMLNEEKRILYRLEFVQNRQKEITAYIEQETGQVQKTIPEIKKQQAAKIPPNFKFMEFDY
jgi:hypothetical protein